MFGRNNEDRLGVKKPSVDPPPVISQDNETKSFEFAYSTPTEFVELPTKGRFYLEGHPLHGKDSVEIRFMTAKDEDILTSKSLLKKGLAVDRMLENIMIDKSLNPDDLVIGDKNAIVVAARISGYGSNYSTNVVCPQCETTVKHEFDLGQRKINHGEDPGVFEVEETPQNTFVITLPKTKAKVETKVLSGHDERVLTNSAKRNQKNNLPESSLTDLFKLYIISVNGNKSLQAINSFIDNMPAIDSRYLRTAYRQVSPNVDLTQDFTCTECNYEQAMEVPFTSDFFWPR